MVGEKSDKIPGEALALAYYLVPRMEGLPKRTGGAGKKTAFVLSCYQ
jgi:hypothetical protein